MRRTRASEKPKPRHEVSTYNPSNLDQFREDPPSPSVRSMPALRPKRNRPRSPTSASDTMDSEEGKKVSQQIQQKLATVVGMKTSETSRYPDLTLVGELEGEETTGIDQVSLKCQEEKEKEIEKNRAELKARTEVAKSGNDEFVREDDQVSEIVIRSLGIDEIDGEERGQVGNTKQVQVEVSKTEVFTNPGTLVNIEELKDIISEEVYFNTVHNQALSQRSPSLWTPTNPHDEKPAILVQIPEWMPLYHTTWYALNVDNLSIYAIHGATWRRIKEKGSYSPRNSDAANYPMELVKGPGQGSPKKVQRSPTSSMPEEGLVYTLNSRDKIPIAESTRRPNQIRERRPRKKDEKVPSVVRKLTYQETPEVQKEVDKEVKKAFEKIQEMHEDRDKLDEQVRQMEREQRKLNKESIKKMREQRDKVKKSIISLAELQTVEEMKNLEDRIERRNKHITQYKEHVSSERDLFFKQAQDNDTISVDLMSYPDELSEDGDGPLAVEDEVGIIKLLIRYERLKEIRIKIHKVLNLDYKKPKTEKRQKDQRDVRATIKQIDKRLLSMKEKIVQFENDERRYYDELRDSHKSVEKEKQSKRRRPTLSTKVRKTLPKRPPPPKRQTGKSNNKLINHGCPKPTLSEQGRDREGVLKMVEAISKGSSTEKTSNTPNVNQGNTGLDLDWDYDGDLNAKVPYNNNQTPNFKVTPNFCVYCGHKYHEGPCKTENAPPPPRPPLKVWCSVCLGTHEVTARCPRCTKCNRIGHDEIQCTYCIICKNHGHMDKQCPLNKETTPDILGAKFAGVICIHCRSTSHVIEECEKYRRYQEKKASTLCPDCGEVGHGSEECLDERKILKRKRELDQEKARRQKLLDTLDEEIRKQEEVLDRDSGEPNDGESGSRKKQGKNRKREHQNEKLKGNFPRELKEDPIEDDQGAPPPPGAGGDPPGDDPSNGEASSFEFDDSEEEEDELSEDTDELSGMVYDEDGSYRLSEVINERVRTLKEEGTPMTMNIPHVLRGPRGHRGTRGKPGRRGKRGPIGPQGPTGPVGPQGTTVPSVSPQLNNTTLNTSNLEASFRDLGNDIRGICNAQNVFNQTIGTHLNETLSAQRETVTALQAIDKTHRRRDFDSMVATIPVYDGKEEAKFEDWLEQIETVARVSRRDPRMILFEKARGAMASVLTTINYTNKWSDYRAELKRYFSNIKSKIHANAMYLKFRHQNKGENTRCFIHDYNRIHLEATSLEAEQDSDLRTKLHFLQRLRNQALHKKVLGHDDFRLNPKMTLKECQTLAIDFEYRYVEREGMAEMCSDTPEQDASILQVPDEAVNVIGQDTKNEGTNAQVGQPNTFKRNIGPCFECGNHGHLSRECPWKLVSDKVSALDKVVGKITTTLEAETPIHFKDVNDIVNRALRKEKSKILQKKISTKINQKLNHPPLDPKFISQTSPAPPIGRGRGRGNSQGQQNMPQPGAARKQEQQAVPVGRGRGRGVTFSQSTLFCSF